jgi:hypothetical protein
MGLFDWVSSLSTGDWALVSLVVTLLLAALPYLVPPRIHPQRRAEDVTSSRTIRIPIPRRYPRKSTSGHVVLTRERVLLTLSEEQIGYAINRAGLFIGFGMFFMLYLILSQLSASYPYLQISPNLDWTVSILCLPIGLELVGVGLVRDAHRRMRSDPWIEVRGEILAWKGYPHTRRTRAALTADERDWLSRIEKEEEEG